MLAVSRLNYPGAEALNRLHLLAGNDTGVVKVHMDTLACMTGVTRFLEKPPPVLDDESAAFWIYDKTEDEMKLLDPLFWEGFDYALSERPELVIGRWQIMETVAGFAGVSIVRPGDDLNAATVELGSSNESWQTTMFAGGRVEALDLLMGKVWNGGFENPMRRYVTRGWWAKVKMEPRIRILKKERIPLWAELDRVEPSPERA